MDSVKHIPIVIDEDVLPDPDPDPDPDNHMMIVAGILALAGVVAFWK